MPATETLPTPDEVSRLGREIFDRRVRQSLRPEDDGKFIAIDVLSGEYEVNEDDYAAVTRLRARNQAAEIWLGCVRQPATYRMRRERWSEVL